MSKEIEKAYVAGWQRALEEVMTSVENSVRVMVENFAVPEEYAAEKKPENKIVVEEKKLIIP
jgi:hypothetical protein